MAGMKIPLEFSSAIYVGERPAWFEKAFAGIGAV